MASSSLGWDLQSLGILNADMSLVMDGTTPFLSSSSSSSLDSADHFSTGYLEDALIEFSERSKRRRLLFYTDHDQPTSPQALEESYWSSNINWGLCENLSFMSQLATSQEEHMSTSSMSRISEETNTVTESKSPEDQTVSSYKDSSAIKNNSIVYKDTPLCSNLTPPSGRGDQKRKNYRVVYPFAVVKPGGIEGDMTLNDINERILMRPTRPVRHPVGDFACRPLCISTSGPGLSGKSVVALTRIHTQGRKGTITIIRTKG